ncbi:hypothetical protein CLU83_3983 [Flavobacterium sp. 1]|nr:hypothetical protein CLU83_3983 [Flavobacterium sp. 1]
MPKFALIMPKKELIYLNLNLIFDEKFLHSFFIKPSARGGLNC